MTALLLLVLAATCAGALATPSYGVLAYYALAVAHPQSIWPWIFDSLRASLIVSLATICGVLLAALQGRLNWSSLRSTQARCMLVLCAMVNLSHWFSPFSMAIVSSLPPAVIVSTFNKAVLFYFIAIVTIQTPAQWRLMAYVMTATALYYTYWANAAYFGGESWRFGSNGRLGGPGRTYGDENVFGLIFVVGFPFVYYTALSVRTVWARYALLCCVPLVLHALLLTGSRGGLISVAVAGLYIVLSTKSKFVGVLMLAAAALFVLDQGGTVVNRVDNTVERQQVIEDDEALDPRILSWKAGLMMVVDYPLLGVGAGRFETAVGVYQPGMRSVAHNTFLQFASNSGVLAGALYLSCFVSGLLALRRERSAGKLADYQEVTRRMLVASTLGFLIASIFLDLMLYEILYYLLILLLVRGRLVASGRFIEETP